MKRYSIHTILLSGLSLLCFAACSDEYMEEINSDPSKATTIDPNAQLTTAQLQTYGDLDLTETFRSYLYAFTQQTMGCWNTTNDGGRPMPSAADMGKVRTRLYPIAVKNIVDAEYRSAGDPEKTNIHAAVSIYKVYLLSLLTDIYGDIPYSEAGRGFIDGNPMPRYDTQQEIYEDFFLTLAEAASEIGTGSDRITGDLIYGGDCAKWKKLANSLRLRFSRKLLM